MNDENTRIEAALGRYRVTGPPAELRQRVLAGPRRRRLAFIGWAAVAAMLVLTAGLQWATQQMLQKNARALRSPVVWNADAESAAELLNGNGSGRQYLALVLTADSMRKRSGGPSDMSPSMWKDFQ